MPKALKATGFFVFGLLVSVNLAAQFAPPAGQPGSDAIHADSTAFIGWATTCYVHRGWVQIDRPEWGNATFGSEQSALGKANLDVVSLGDGGMATLGFEYPIWDGPGADFAVFENSFSDDFLELAFVEVSSDGERFVRFPSVSLTQTDVQIDGFGTLDATHIHNLAGKYRAFYGVPFDLVELADSTGLDINNVTHVRVVDVVGNINPMYARYDALGNPINDPWPTPFPTSGFDLDAVGVIHDSRNSAVAANHLNPFVVYPNPVVDQLVIKIDNYSGNYAYALIDMKGTVLLQANGQGSAQLLYLESLPSGIYLLQLTLPHGVYYQRFMKR